MFGWQCVNPPCQAPCGAGKSWVWGLLPFPLFMTDSLRFHPTFHCVAILLLLGIAGSLHGATPLLAPRVIAVALLEPDRDEGDTPGEIPILGIVTGVGTGWSTGHIPLRKNTPYELSRTAEDSSEVFRLNPSLTEWA